MKSISYVMRWFGIALIVVAVVQELRKPAFDRTWRGRLAGFIPYDLRMPTPARFLSAVWNPEDQNVLVGTPFGVGWTINLRALNNLIRRSTNGL